MLRDELLRRFPALATLPPHTEVVGGAVRDLMLHVEPADVDVECDEPLGCASRVGKVITLGRGDLRNRHHVHVSDIGRHVQRHHDRHSPREQLTARLQSQSAVRTGDERDALLNLHVRILAGVGKTV